MTSYFDGDYFDGDSIDDESLDDPYPRLRDALADQYADAEPEEIEDLLAGVGLSAPAVEFSLASIGKAAAKLAPTVLPIAGTAVGTVFGGPVGAALGGALGQAAGGAIGAATAPRRPAPGAPARGAPARGGSPSAAALLQIVQRPEVLKALLAMALGRAGNPTVPVGGAQAPAGAFGNLIGSLAGRALTEHHAVVAGETGMPGYLLDADGAAVVDPTDPAARADRLLEVLAAAPPDPVDLDEDEPVPDEFDEYWDELDLAELNDD